MILENVEKVETTACPPFVISYSSPPLWLLIACTIQLLLRPPLPFGPNFLFFDYLNSLVGNFGLASMELGVEVQRGRVSYPCQSSIGCTKAVQHSTNLSK